MTNKTARWLLCVVLVFVLAASLALAACKQQSTATFAGGQDATGDAPQAITVNTGDVITLPANTFSRQGYDFAGWSDGSKVYQAGDEYTLAQDVTFTAQWTEQQETPPAPAEYTLSFGLGEHAASGAVAPQSTKLQEGATYALPDAPAAAEGWEFAGWGESKLQAGATFTMPAEDTELVAQWTEQQETPPAPAEYTLSFGLGEHAASGAVAPPSANLQEGATYALPAAPAAAEGWEFAGWGESKLQAGATFTMPAEDTELVAQWTEQQVTPPAPAEYTLSFGLGEHAASGAVAPPSTKLQEGATYALPAAPAAAEGWEFAGWGESKLQAGATFTMPAEDTELVAQWTEKQVTPPAEQVTVTFKVEETVFDTQTINKGALATKPAQDPTDPNGEKTFRYWTDDEGTEFLFTTPVTQDITLNAKFAICVTFDLDGGTGTRLAPVWEESYSPTGISVQLPAAEGYSKGEQVLTGWSDGSQTYQPGTTQKFTFSVTLTAVWGEAQTEPTKYSVEYYRGVTSDTGFSGQAPEGAGEYTVGEQITLPACTWTRIGYNFAGWKVRRWVENLEYSEGGYWENMPDVEILQPEGKYTMPSEKIQISAQWTAATVTVVYDSNGGSGSMANGSFVFEKSLTPAENGFTAPEGKVFGGWALEATAQEAAELTPLGALANATYLSYVKFVGSDWTLTLYAIWNEAPAPSIDFAELCGVWTNDTKTIILLSEGEDSYEGTVGSAIVNGNAFYKLVKYDNLLIDSETYGELCSITINSETSITCDGTTYTAKADVKNGTVADLAGTWNFGLSSKLTITSLGKATISQNGSDTSSTLLYVDKYVVVFYTKSYQLTSYVLTLNETKDKLIGYSRISEGSPKSIEFTKDSTPPIEEKTLKYVGEAQTVYGSMTVIFKSIEMIEGDDTYAKLTYTVDGTEHVDELKNDETNKTFMKQVTTASWPGTSAYTVIKFWKMYPLANPPYTKNSNASYPGTSYSVGLTGDGTKLVIALSTGDVGVLTLEGSEELPPEELPIFTGMATYTTKGFGNVTFTVTQIEIDPTVLTTEAYITYSTAVQESKRVAVTLTDNSNSKSNYEGEGEPKFYYSMYLSSESGRTAFYLAVIDDNTVVLCDSDDKPLGTFTTGGGTVTPTTEHTVTLKTDGTTVWKTVTVKHGETLQLDEVPQDPNGLKTFYCWNTDLGQFDLETPITEDITLEAVFRICITFDLDGGTGTQPEPVWATSPYYPRGFSVTMPTAEGYSKGEQVLIGWSDGETTYDPGEDVTFEKSQKLTAVWGTISTDTEYTVTYEKGLHAASGDVPPQEKHKAGDTFNLPANPFSCEGKSFDGWLVGSDTEPKAPGSQVTMPGEDLTVKGKWSDVNITVKYDSNGGSGTMSTQTSVYNKTLTGFNVECTFNAPEGMEFVGWSLTKTGPVLTGEYGDSSWSSIKSYVQHEGDEYSITLYAIWQTAKQAFDIEQYVGVYTHDGAQLVISSVGKGEEIDLMYTTLVSIGSAIYNNEFILLGESEGTICGVGTKSGEQYFNQITFTFQDDGVTVSDLLIDWEIEDDPQPVETTYTQKQPINNATLAEFKGDWARTGTSIKIAVGDDSVQVSQNESPLETTYYIVDKYLVAIYQNLSTTYQYVLSLSGEQLIGWFAAPDKDLVEVTFDKQTSGGETGGGSPDEPESDEVIFVGELEAGTFLTGTYVITSIKIKDSADATTAYITYTYNGNDCSQEVELTKKSYLSYGKYGFDFDLPGENGKKMTGCELIFLDNGNLEVYVSDIVEFTRQG